MRITERGVLLPAATAVLATAFGVAIADGALAGFHHPGLEALYVVVLVACGAVITGAHPGHAVGRLLM